MFVMTPLFNNSQERLEHKENQTKYRSMTWEPRSHVRILISPVGHCTCSTVESINICMTFIGLCETCCISRIVSPHNNELFLNYAMISTIL